MRPLAILALLALAGFASAQPANGVLRVVSPEMPARFAPTGIVADSERAALDLIFESLLVVSTDADGNRRVRPVLAERLPDVDGVGYSFRLRSDRRWPSKEPVTAHDIRHAVRLLQADAGAELAWHDGLKMATPGDSSRDVRIELAHGSIEPWPWFTFRVVPKMFRDRELDRLDDESFVKAPVGSGPFQVDGIFKDDVRPYVRFGPNPGFGGPLPPVREIRWFGSTDPKEIAKIAPDVAIGYDAETLKPLAPLTPIAVHVRRIEYVAVNQRHPDLANVEVRRFLGTALNFEPPANGLAPSDSWTSAPRVPKSWHRKAEAETLAKSLKAKPLELSLKFAGSKALADDVIAQWKAEAKAADWDLRINPVPLAPSALAEALRKHDYELALTHEDRGDEIPRLAALFDPRPEALKEGGSNVLGAVLRDSLRVELFRTRQFPRLVERAHNLHFHLWETMPLIPLRPVPTIAVGVGRRWQWTPGDGVRPFADWTSWREHP